MTLLWITVIICGCKMWSSVKFPLLWRICLKLMNVLRDVWSVFFSLFFPNTLIHCLLQSLHLSYYKNLFCFSIKLLAIGGGYTENTQVGFDWLSRQVAMVKAVIKAIKAAGVGLNGSSDCSCCHKLNRKGEQERMEKTWKDGIKRGKNAQRKKNIGEKRLKCGWAKCD